MAGTMRAAVYQAPRDIRLERVPIPRAGPSDVLVRVSHCGICGSDVHSYRSGMYVDAGQVPGHEFAGEVTEVGDQVTGVATGDRVTGFSLGVCGECYWCRRGQVILCPRLFKNSTGYGQPGAFADYVLIRDAVLGATVHKLPDGLDDESAATAEPVSIGVNTAAQAGIQPGDQVVVLGGGMIGNACMQAARAAGAATVVLVEVSPRRLDAAVELGATAVFDARSGDPLAWVKKQVGAGPYHFNEGAMADVVIEAAGAPATVVQAFEMVRSGGTIAFVGLPEEPAPVDVTKIVHKAPRIVGVLGGDLGAAVGHLAAGTIRTRPLITHRFALDDVAEAFETQLRAEEAVKVMVHT